MEKRIAGFMWALGLLHVLAASARTVVGITCTEAILTLTPCQSFLVGLTPSPPGTCCEGVKTVNDAATTKEDRQQLCECLKAAAPRLGVIPDRAKQLPGLCHVDVPVPIDPDIDCSKIN